MEAVPIDPPGKGNCSENATHREQQVCGEEAPAGQHLGTDKTKKNGYPHHQQNRQQQQQQRKTNRPKRVRKRPRSETQANANLQVQTTVQRLELAMNDTTDDETAGGDTVGVKTPILVEAGGTEQFFRVVHPYPYTFASYCKERWIGRTVLDVYTAEFGSYPENYYIAAIQQGRILISDEKVDLDYKIQEKDVLTHTVHRHEPAVAVCSTTASTSTSVSTPSADEQPIKAPSSASSCLINIVDETDNLLIVDKPGTLPVHPCGGYHLNSLTSILEGGNNNDEPTIISNNNKQQQQAKHYYTIHRLDRLTSGLVILAKSSEVAKHWSECIRQRDCQKYYLARVKGHFPLNLEHHHNDTADDDGGGGGLQRIQTGNSSSGVPQNGEWPNTTHQNTQQQQQQGQTSTNDTVTTAVEEARRKHAQGFWITDASGSTVLDDVSLSDLANTQIDNVDECLEYLDSGSSGNNATDKSNNNNKSSIRYWLHLACPTRIVRPKNGVCQAGRFQDLEDGLYQKTVKPAQTSFAVIKYDAKTDSTLVLCRPVTGRTHQIRLHCQFLGHAIANDPNYGGDIWYNNPEGEAACAKARDLLDSSHEGEDDKNGDGQNDNNNDTKLEHKNLSDTPASVKEIESVTKMEAQGDEEPTEDFIQRTCVWCARCKGRDVVETNMLEFLVRSRGIWLHALKYCIGQGEGEGDGSGTKFRSFRTELPPWGKL